jgi:hypothetical protein
MKKHKYLLLAALILGACATFDSCQYTPELEIEDEESQSQTLTVSVDPSIWETSTRTATTMTPALPIHYYLYDKTSAAFIGDQEIAEGEVLSANFSVAKGSYTLYVITGTSLGDYTTMDLTKDFAFDASAGEDVCLGHADVTVSKYYSESQSVTIKAKHVFSQLALELKDVPTSVTTITAYVPALHTGIQWDGTYTSDTMMATLNLTKAALPTKAEATTTTWSVSQYLYPSAATTGLKVGLNFAHGTSHTEYLTASVSNNLTSGDKLTISTNYVSSTASPGIELDAWTESSGTDLTITVGSGSVSGGGQDQGQNNGQVSGDGQGSGGDGKDSNQVTYTAGSMYKPHVLIVSVENGNLLLMGTQSTPEADLSSYMSSDEELCGKWGKPTKAQWESIFSVLEVSNGSKTKFNENLVAKDSEATQANSTYGYAINDNKYKYFDFSEQDYVESTSKTVYVYPVAVISISSTDD